MRKVRSKKRRNAIAEAREQTAEVNPGHADEVRPEVMEVFERVVNQNRELLRRLANTSNLHEEND